MIKESKKVHVMKEEVDMIIFDENEHFLEYEYNYNIAEKKAIREEIEFKDNITIDEIRRIALWKYDRIIEVDHDLLEQLAELKNIRELNIEDDIVKSILESLVDSTGIGYPLASTILKFLRPDVFPIIDVRAYRALFGKKIQYQQYSYDIYVTYCKRVYEIQDKLKLPLSIIDEQLYEFDKKCNGLI